MGERRPDRSEFLVQGCEQGNALSGASEEYGGVGADFRYNMVVAEEVCLGLTGIGFSLHTMTTPYLTNVANEAQNRNTLVHLW